MSGREENTELAAAVEAMGALPVPVGPQMPDFPPPPRTELEKAHAERARLQGLLADAVRDAHLASRERDLMRERVSEPYGCAHCGIAKRSHGRRWTTGVGYHAWAAPTQGQIAERMRARRTVRVASDNDRLRARVAELEAERHVTNEALDDAVQGLRERDGRIAELEALTPAAIQTCRKCGAGYTLGEPCSTCMFRERMAAETSTRALRDDDELEARAGDAAMVCLECNAPVMWVDSANGGWWNHTGPVEDGHGIVPKPLLRPSVEVSADKLARLLAPTQASPEDPPVEDPHDSPLYHRYETGRDLPETGGAR